MLVLYPLKNRKTDDCETALVTRGKIERETTEMGRNLRLMWSNVNSILNLCRDWIKVYRNDNADIRLIDRGNSRGLPS